MRLGPVPHVSPTPHGRQKPSVLVRPDAVSEISHGIEVTTEMCSLTILADSGETLTLQPRKMTRPESEADGPAAWTGK
jgi:hypothetical protein